MKRAPRHMYPLRIPMDLWNFLRDFSKKNNRDVSGVIIESLYTLKKNNEKKVIKKLTT